MARIRTIKPDFWTSEQIVECSRDARLMFIGMWNFADDGGVLPSSPKGIKMKIFPGEDDIDSATIRRMLDELSSNGLIVEYERDEKRYIKIEGWQHQRIDRPNFRYPQPNSTSNRRVIDERSPPEGKRKGNGRESNRAFIERFEKWYSNYPNKKAKQAAWKAWKRMDPTDEETDQYVEAVHQQRRWRHALRDAGEVVPEWPHPSTVLNQGRGEDKLDWPSKSEDIWAGTK